MRTELIFPLLTKILRERYGVTFTFGHYLKKVNFDSSSESVVVFTKKTKGKWGVTRNGVMKLYDTEVKRDSEDWRRTIAEYNVQTFDRLVISTGAAVGNALRDLDPSMHSDLIPAMGCIAVSAAEFISKEQRTLGVIYENEHQYLRSTVDGKLAMGGGMWFPAATGENASGTDEVRSLPYRQGSYLNYAKSCDGIMAQTPIGKALVEAEGTIKLGGARPMSYLGNHPLIKQHTSGRIIINTGGGANGYVMAWKSAQLVTELALHGQISEPIWRNSYSSFTSQLDHVW